MKKILCGAAALIIIGIIGIRTYNDIKEQRLQREIAESLIRFHVRANSDSAEDQELKLTVKNAIVEYLQGELSDASELREAREIITEDMETIKSIAQQVIAEAGYDYSVKAYFEQAYFPVKMYGDMTFPAGRYEAFRVDIGEGDGRNWWCVLFPPLCFVDSTYAVVPDETKADFRAVLSDEAYRAITMKDIENNNYEIRFKYLTFLNRFLE